MRKRGGDEGGKHFRWTRGKPEKTKKGVHAGRAIGKAC